MRTLDSRTAAPLVLEPQMTPDWNAIRLDLLQVDEPMRAALRQMRPFFAKSLPGILARYYDKVRHYDPSSGIFKNGAMQEVIRMQLQHWELIAACNFGPDYLASTTRFCELNQRAGVAPQWYVGGRQMFIADQLMKATDSEIAIPRFGRAAQAARDRQPDRRGIGSIVVIGKAIVAYHRQPAGRDRRFPQVDCGGGLTAFSQRSEAL